MRIITALISSFMLVSLRFAQTDSTREVQARYAECNALEKTGKKFEFQGTRISETHATWQKLDPKTDPVWDLMGVYTSQNHVRSVRLEQSSPSGDWGSVTTYCYRANGTLAFKFQFLSTFYHDEVPGLNVLEVELRSYFSPNGKNFKNLEKMRNGVSNKPVQTTYMRSGGPDFPTSQSIVKEIGEKLLPAK
jgi:hypothetical protein